MTLKMKLLLVMGLQIAAPVFALAPHAVKPKAPIYSCPQKWLTQKDCRFSDQKLTVEVWRDKILAHDVRFRDTITIPYAGKSIEWRSVRLRNFGKRRLIEIELWAKPDSLTGIQTRKWLVYEWQNGRLKIDLNKSVQKRTQLANGQYRYDPVLRFGLISKIQTHKVGYMVQLRNHHRVRRWRVIKTHKIVWYCDRNVGTLGRF